MSSDDEITMAFTTSELLLLDDALDFWARRIDYACNNNTPPVALVAAGEHVAKRIEELRAKLAPTLPEPKQ